MVSPRCQSPPPPPSSSPPPPPSSSSPLFQSHFRFDIHSLVQCVNTYPNIFQWLVSQPQPDQLPHKTSTLTQIYPGSWDHLIYLKDSLELDIVPHMEIAYHTNSDNVSYGYGSNKACKIIPMVRLHVLDVDIAYIPPQEEIGIGNCGVMVAYGREVRLIACVQRGVVHDALSMDEVLGYMTTVLTRENAMSIEMMQEADLSNSGMDHVFIIKKRHEHEATVSPIPSIVTATTTTTTTSTATKEQVLTYIKQVNQMPAAHIQRYECKLCQSAQPKSTFARKYDLRRHLVTKHVPESDADTYDCEICGRCFKRRDHLNVHSRSVHHQFVSGARSTWTVSDGSGTDAEHGATAAQTHDIKQS